MFETGVDFHRNKNERHWKRCITAPLAAAPTIPDRDDALTATDMDDGPQGPATLQSPAPKPALTLIIPRHNRRPESKISSFVGVLFVNSSDLPLPALRDAVFMQLTSSTAAMEEKIEASEDSAITVYGFKGLHRRCKRASCSRQNRSIVTSSVGLYLSSTFSVYLGCFATYHTCGWLCYCEDCLELCLIASTHRSSIQ